MPENLISENPNFFKKYKKSILVVLILVLVVIVLWFVKNRIGDIRPALLPSGNKLVNQIEKQQVGEAVELPLVFSNNYKIGVFAKNIPRARDLQFSPGGTLLISELGGSVFALPDKNQDGSSDEKKEILSGLNIPHGLAFHENKLFVAELTEIIRYSWDETNLKATREKKIMDLPTSNGHQTRTMAIKEDGTLFVTIGSICNVCIEKDERLATVMVSDVDGNNPRIWAKGLRNSVFIVLNHETNELWGTEMGRDLLGDNIPPEEINIIRDGKDYGWPICYDDKIHDTQFDKKTYAQDPCQDTVAPIFKMQAHSAPLGLAFIDSDQFPDDWQGDLLVSFHGSWNRSEPTGYKIVRLKVDGNEISEQEDFMTGFLGDVSALGRPVDLTFDQAGSLFISDDKAGAVYKLSKK